MSGVAKHELVRVLAPIFSQFFNAKITGNLTLMAGALECLCLFLTPEEYIKCKNDIKRILNLKPGIESFEEILRVKQEQLGELSDLFNKVINNDRLKTLLWYGSWFKGELDAQE